MPTPTTKAKPAQPTAAGIITDVSSGERVIPASTRPDGTTRKVIRIRPGYRPPEDVEVYKNRTAETFRTRNTGPVPGAAGLVAGAGADDNDPAAATSASNKNAKRREARRKAKAAASSSAEATTTTTTTTTTAEEKGGGLGEGSGDVEAPANGNAAATAEDGSGKPAQPETEADKEKKAKNLRKKLRQARELQQKKENGESLLPEQTAKVIKINDLVQELERLGFHSDGEPTKKSGAQKDAAESENTLIAIET